jgi:hypothetical protein
MPLTMKVLWVVNINTEAAETNFTKHALACGANGVCIRTSSTRLAAAIPRFQALGMKVYAWRWPQVTPASLNAEANNVANVLVPAGLDGYIVDPESDGPGGNNWNQTGLGPRAAAFCNTIKTAAAGRHFLFGTTSGCGYPGPRGKPNIPWNAFFTASDVLLPQTYWRWTNNGRVGDINGGSPAKSIARGLAAWGPQALGRPILPMAGEIDVITPEEIAAYGTLLGTSGVRIAHFYTDNGNIPLANLAAIRAL